MDTTFDNIVHDTHLSNMEKLALKQMYRDLLTEVMMHGAEEEIYMNRIGGALTFLKYQGKIEANEDEDLWVLVNEIEDGKYNPR